LGFFVLVGLGSGGFVGWASFFLFLGCFFFSISSFAFFLVYYRCTKGRLTLLIKSVYYLSKISYIALGLLSTDCTVLLKYFSMVSR